MSDWIIIFLTTVLVGATIYYAWQTRQTVEEMRQARASQVLPRLVPTLSKLPAANVLLQIINAGPGSAFNVDVELMFEPGGEPIPFVAPVMSPGEFQEFFAPGQGPGSTEIQLAAITAVFKSLRLRGHCSDALGTRHDIDETLDLDHFAKLFLDGMWVQPDDEHLKTISDSVKTLVSGWKQSRSSSTGAEPVAPKRCRPRGPALYPSPSPPSASAHNADAGRPRSA